MLDFLTPSTNSHEAAAKLEALGKSQAIIEFNMDGTIITANGNFLNVMGYTLEEIQGRNHSMFVDPEYRNSVEYRQFWESLNRGEFKAAQFKRFGKGGKEIWIEASYNPILDRSGKPYKVVKFATDVTSQKLEYGDLLGKANAISRSQAIIEFNMDGTIITANENFLSVMGYSLAEVKGKHHSMFAEAAYAGSPEYKEFWARLNRGEYQAGQYKRLGKGGREVWIEASYNPIFDLNGKAYKVVKFAVDLTKRKTDNMKLASSVKGLVKTVTQSASSMQTTAESLAATAEETSQKSQAVAAASEELTSSVAEISRQLSEAAMVVNSAVNEAKNSEQMVSTLINAAQKIGSVSDVVAQIAGQTNLLALNATIEAARAGEAGKGFSVVASEVKSLANQTAKATDEIGQQVKGIQDSSQLTGQGIQQIVKTISKVSEISTSISGAVEEQSAATREVSQNITIVKQAAAQTGQSSASVLEVTQELAKRAAELEKQIDEFIAGM